MKFIKCPERELSWVGGLRLRNGQTRARYEHGGYCGYCDFFHCKHPPKYLIK